MRQKLTKAIKDLRKEFRFLTINKTPFLFDHLPKCGGTSVNNYLINYYPKRFVFGLSGINPQKSVDEFHNMPKDKRWQKKLIYGHLANDLFEYIHPDTFIATIFREPIDRIVSHYYFVKQTTNHYLHDKIEQEQITLKDYCSLNLSPELSNWYVTHFTGLTPLHIENKPNEAIALAFENILKTYNLIGFQDDIPKFILALNQLLSIKTKNSINRSNKTQNRLQIVDLDQKTLASITRSNSLDIQLYSKLNALRQNGVIIPNTSDFKQIWK